MNDVPALHLLHQASQKADEVFTDAIAARGDLTPRQFVVLKAIEVEEDPSQTKLLRKTGIDHSTMASIVSRLSKRGLIERRRTAEDARAYAVRLTDLGRDTLRQAEPVARYTDKRLLSALSGTQREQFLRLLCLIRLLAVRTYRRDTRRHFSAEERSTLSSTDAPF